MDKTMSGLELRSLATSDGQLRLSLETVTLDAPATGERQIRYDDIERARTVFEWGPAPKPGSGKKAVNA